MLAAFCVLLPLFGGCNGYVQAVATPRSLVESSMADPPREVRVAGRVQQMVHHTSRSGSAYDIFLLCSQGCVRVFRFGRTTFNDGDTVSVMGTYYAERHLGRSVYRKEIDAQEIVLER